MIERRSTFMRLDLEEAIGGSGPIRDYTGPQTTAITPHPLIRRDSESERYRMIDSPKQRTPQTQATKHAHQQVQPRTPASHLENLTKPTSKSCIPTMTSIPKRSPRVFSPKWFTSKRDLSPLPADDGRAKTEIRRTSRYISNRRTFVPGSIVGPPPPTLPHSSDASDPFRPNQSSGAPEGESSPGGSTPTRSRSPTPADPNNAPSATATTTEQWGGVTRHVLGRAGGYMLAGRPPIEGGDIPTTCRPVAWLTNRARACDTSFRPHRPQTHIRRRRRSRTNLTRKSKHS